jgi:hypothetical protein
MMDIGADWPAFALLGAGHGINPAMGWLFAVALAMQERQGSRVWKAIGPLALGHLIAVAAALAVGAAVEGLVAPGLWRYGVAGLLVGFGALRLLRPRHPSYGGMRVRSGQLVVWSALMATAHGAGLMLLPFTGDPRGASAVVPVGQVAHAGLGHGGITMDGALTGSLVHTASYLTVTALIAAVVYHKAGVGFLRRAWVNLDVIWAGALIVTGVFAAL